MHLALVSIFHTAGSHISRRVDERVAVSRSNMRRLSSIGKASRHGKTRALSIHLFLSSAHINFQRLRPTSPWHGNAELRISAFYPRLKGFEVDLKNWNCPLEGSTVAHARVNFQRPLDFPDFQLGGGFVVTCPLCEQVMVLLFCGGGFCGWSMGDLTPMVIVRSVVRPSDHESSRQVAG